MANPTILLIDYDPHSIQDVLGPLTEAGYRVEVARDGQSGIEAYHRIRPDLVLIEPMVPKKHGFEVCQEIKASGDGRQVPVVITTGFYRGRRHQMEARQYYGCDDYLEKPIAGERILSACKRFLDAPTSSAAPAPPVEAAPAAAPPPSAAPSPRGTGGTVPALDDLSEDEIVERLDALIREEPVAAGMVEADHEEISTDDEIRDERDFEADEIIEELESATLAAADATAPIPEVETTEDASPPTPEKVEEGILAADHVEPLSVAPEDVAPVSAEPEAADTAHGVSGAEAIAGPSASAPVASADRRAATEAEPLAVDTARRRRIGPWLAVAAAVTVVAVAGAVFLLPRLTASRTADTTSLGDRTPGPGWTDSARTGSSGEAALDLAGPTTDPAGYAETATPATGPIASTPLTVDETASSETPTGSRSSAPSADDGVSSAVAESRPSRPVTVRPDDTAPKTAARPAVPRDDPATTGVAAEAETSSAASRHSTRTTTDAGPEAPAPVEARPAVPPAIPKVKPADEPQARSDDGAVEDLAPPQSPEPSPAPAGSDDGAGEDLAPPRSPELPPAPAGPVDAGATQADARSVEDVSGPASGSDAEPTAEAVPPEPPRPEVEYGALVDPSKLDRPPEPKVKPLAEYPPVARRLKLAGTVDLLLLLGPDGRVERTRIESSDAGDILDKAATKAATGWVYEPATSHGVPVRVWVRARVEFRP